MAQKYVYDETYNVKGWFDTILTPSGWFDTGFSEDAGLPPSGPVFGKVKLAGVFTSIVDRKFKTGGVFSSAVGYKVKIGGTFVDLV